MAYNDDNGREVFKIEAKENGARYTYADYAKWDDGNRWELIDGVPFMMSPAPSPNHQRIIAALTADFYAYLRGKPCEVFPAPFDVRLDADAEDDTVVQPDLSIICDPKKVDDKGCKGAPDMVVEILSPSTRERDQGIKLRKYLAAGVREYWIVDEAQRLLYVYSLENSDYIFHVYDDTQDVAVGIFEDCTIHLAEVFPAPESTSGPDEEQKAPGGTPEVTG